MSNRFTRRSVAAIALAASLAVVAPLAAHAAVRPRAASFVVNEGTSVVATAAAGLSATSGLSAADWRQTQRNAQKSGDLVGAQAVGNYLNPRNPGRASPYGIKTKLVKVLLRHGGPALAKALKKASPRAAAWIEKNSGRLANWLDELEGLSELGITSFLASQGVDPGVARDIARWLVLFAG